MPAFTLEDLMTKGVKGRTVLVRSDLNVPLDEERNVTDAGRVKASIPVISRLAIAGARVIVMAHLGRPKGEPDPALSIRPAAEKLAELSGLNVKVAEDVVGESAQSLAQELADGEVLVIENVRFEAGETSKDDADVRNSRSATLRWPARTAPTWMMRLARFTVSTPLFSISLVFCLRIRVTSFVTSLRF